MDADLVLVDLNRSATLTVADLHQRHALTPYLGHQFCGKVRRTIRRGVTIFNDGRVTATSGGRLIRPS
jgi:allantoinase